MTGVNAAAAATGTEKPKRVIAETVVFTREHQAWKAMMTKGETRRMYAYDKAGKPVFILAPSERRALLKWAEIEAASVPVRRVTKQILAEMVSAAMERLEQTTEFQKQVIGEKIATEKETVSHADPSRPDAGGMAAGAGDRPEQAPVPDGNGEDSGFDPETGYDPSSNPHA